MASTYLSTLTQEERAAAFKAAQEERERIIQEAINNGAYVQRTSSRISQDEQETHISYGLDGSCIIDTTIQSDIKKCIRRGWQITSVAYYKDTDQVIGMMFKGKSKNISIRNI